MIQMRIGDLFQSQAQTLVNTVNCVGVMGKGIAAEFKKRFPAMYADYRQRCDAGRVRLGEPYHYRDVVGASIINFPTKDHWRSPSRLEDIVRGLDYLVAHLPQWGHLAGLAAAGLRQRWAGMGAGRAGDAAQARRARHSRRNLCSLTLRSRVPQRNTARGIRITRQLALRRPVPLGDERWRVAGKKLDDLRHRRDEVRREHRERRLADHHQ